MVVARPFRGSMRQFGLVGPDRDRPETADDLTRT
jgi:hypothetical protein